jgi:flagellar motor switch protein FliG
MAAVDYSNLRLNSKVNQLLHGKTVLSDEDIKKCAVNPIKVIANIINYSDYRMEKAILSALEAYDYELYENIRKKMFEFGDIIRLSGRDIQLILREVDTKHLVIALKNVSDEIKAVIFKNLSRRMGEMIKEDMDYMGPIRRVDIEDSQQYIVNIIRRLCEAGEIIIPKRLSDDIVI